MSKHTEPRPPSRPNPMVTQVAEPMGWSFRLAFGALIGIAVGLMFGLVALLAYSVWTWPLETLATLGFIVICWGIGVWLSKWVAA